MDADGDSPPPGDGVSTVVAASMFAGGINTDIAMGAVNDEYEKMRGSGKIDLTVMPSPETAQWIFSFVMNRLDAHLIVTQSSKDCSSGLWDGREL